MGQPTLGWDGTTLTRIQTDSSGRLEIIIQGSALPSGAATSAKQDTLAGKFKDQVFSFKGKLLDAVTNGDTAAGDIGLAGTTVPAGEVWVVTSVLAINTVTVPTSIYLYVVDDGSEAAFRRGDTPSITAGLSWSGHLYLVTGDKVNATFMGCALHDVIHLQTLGYKMTAV